MHFIIGGVFVSSSHLSDSQTSLHLSSVSGSPRVYILQKLDVLAISDRESQAHKKISIINTPQAILLLMFILHTLLGAGRCWPNPLCVGSGVRTWESPHYYYHYYCLKISPMSHFIFIQDKVFPKVLVGKEEIVCYNVVDVGHWFIKIHNYV